jgi:hypothetical protein
MGVWAVKSADHHVHVPVEIEVANVKGRMPGADLIHAMPIKYAG